MTIQENHTVSILLRASTIISRSLDPEDSISSLLKLLSERMQLTNGRVVLPDAEQVLRIQYAYGVSPAEYTKGHYEIGEGITGKVMKTGKIALIPDVSREPEYLARANDTVTLSSDTVAYIAVPIVQESKPMGVLAAYRTHPMARQLEQDIDVLRIIAAMIQQVLRIHELVKETTAKLRQENKSLKTALSQGAVQHDIIGHSRALKKAVEQALQAATSKATVMLYGESGTGKEKFARMIHMASDRRDQPFVSINCAAIPAHLLESELFGHTKGSFTGATQDRIGKFEMANEGTLFLDEIGDMPLELQSKLLRTLQEKSIQRVGGNNEIQINVRVLTATHQDIQAAVNSGEFRLDLYYRLNVLPIFLPPLRERTGDVRILSLYFLNRANQTNRSNTIFTPEGLDMLEDYDWPGNIRQLENVIERLVIMSNDSQITRIHVDAVLRDEASVSLHAVNGRAIESRAYNGTNGYTDLSARPYSKVRSDEKDIIIAALETARGNKTRAALNLGLTPRQLQYRVKKLEIATD